MASHPDAEAQLAKDDGKDIRQILTSGERADLTLLVAKIMEIMAKQIHDTFDASLSSATKPPHKLTIDGKNANKTISGSHKETDEEDAARKLLERREKELSAPKMLELKNEALKFFGNWRESLMSRLGEAVNDPVKDSKAVTTEEPQNPTEKKATETASHIEDQTICKLSVSKTKMKSDKQPSAYHKCGRSRFCVDSIVPTYINGFIFASERQENFTTSFNAITYTFP